MSNALSIRGLELSRMGQAVLRGVDLDVHPGEICVVLGASGAGKSTVLRCVAALEAFSAGTIRVGDAELHAGPTPRQSSLSTLRSRVAMVFQSHALFEHLSALENVVLAPMRVQGWSADEASTRAMALLSALGVEHRAAALPRHLSGGEAQRVAIARALIGNPDVLLMDEPTAALDPARRGNLATTLRELAGGGRAMLIATHDMDFARAAADRTWTLEAGRLLAEE